MPRIDICSERMRRKLPLLRQRHRSVSLSILAEPFLFRERRCGWNRSRRTRTSREFAAICDSQSLFRDIDAQRGILSSRRGHAFDSMMNRLVLNKNGMNPLLLFSALLRRLDLAGSSLSGNSGVHFASMSSSGRVVRVSPKELEYLEEANPKVDACFTEEPTESLWFTM